jgi:hypothetical protein
MKFYIELSLQNLEKTQEAIDYNSNVNFRYIIKTEGLNLINGKDVALLLNNGYVIQTGMANNEGLYFYHKGVK